MLAKSKRQQEINKTQKQKGSDIKLYAPGSKSLALRSMLYALCFVLFAFSSMLLCCSSALAEGVSLWGNMNYISTEQEENGERILTQSSYLRNLYFNFEKPITPLISYQINFRTNWSDFRLTDADDRITKTYQRAIEPAFDLFLRNPIYDLSAGYRRLEQWTTAHLQNEGRRTTDFVYTRLNITPRELPSLSLEFNRQQQFDYLSPKTLDTTDTRYSANSWYQYLYKGLTLSYNFTYAYDVNETPLNIIEKTKNNNLNGLYNISYFKTFWGGKTDISASYQGNYIRDRNQQFATQSGSTSNRRGPRNGLYIRDLSPQTTNGTTILPNEIWEQPSSLIDVVSVDDFNDPGYRNPATVTAGNINIGLNGNNYQNIGVRLSSSEKSVDKLYIYVRAPSQPNAIEWRAYITSDQIPNRQDWQQIYDQSVSATILDAVNGIYRYEIIFSTPQTSIYFKAVNIQSANINDVFVTEIEARGTDVVTAGKTTDVSTFFNQGINLIANLRPIPKLNFSFNYFLNRSDQNPVSIWNSVSGVFSNLVSNSISDEEKLRSNILRSYGATTTWYSHRLLTTTLRLQRNESFDNMDETDFSSNSYTLSFNSAPIPTLDTNLSFIRSDNYNFGKKETTNNSILFSILSKLYRDVNMVTDMFYTRSKSYVTDTMSNTSSIRGSLNATLTQKLYGSLIYGLSWTSTDNTSSTSTHTAEGQTIITYRPGRFINISGNLRVLNMDDGTTTSEGILVDWLPLPALRLNLNYLHSSSDAESEPSVRDLLSAYFIWYITKFLDLQVTYSYTREERDTDTKNYTFGANLNCRFW